uniref:Trafficking protein particle complex subunit n=1 Tax=Corethron hystrix TaxID=216773 RepID=A0A7S1BMD0_9STRA|mmetsp:Transcript_34145/g.78836  ORF Transcript_34145/g.78836 Transcript_34145/m.78836 type:complete len:159 (+) Transcript_34145:206-682(+)
MCALACLAVLDRQNAPLYVRGDFSSFFGSSPSFDGEEPDGSVSDSRGIGGAASAEAGGGPTPPAVNFASLRHQFMIHAALDHIDEKVRDIISLGGQTNNNDMMYLGFLCPVEEMRLYGECHDPHDGDGRWFFSSVPAHCTRAFLRPPLMLYFQKCFAF